MVIVYDSSILGILLVEIVTLERISIKPQVRERSLCGMVSCGQTSVVEVPRFNEK